MGSRFGQDIEPAGRYMIHNEEPGDVARGWEAGEVSFERPLVIELTTDGEVYGPNGWKARLQRTYGATGAELSRRMLDEGWDGIVTASRFTDINGRVYRETREIVDLRPVRRRNADEGLRAAERQYRRTGDTSDCLRWAHERVRAGEIPAEIVEGEAPWHAGMPSSLRGPEGTRRKIWEASLCSGEQIRRTAFFGWNGFGFEGELEAIASPSAYRLAADAIRSMYPDTEFVMASHPDDPVPQFTVILRNGGIVRRTFAPTEDKEALRAMAMAELHHGPLATDPGQGEWWRHWNPHNYPSMTDVAMMLSNAIAARRHQR